MAAHYSRIHRLLQILTLIQSEPGWTTRKLADTLLRNQRTIFRDIEMLRAAEIPCHFDPEKKSYYIGREFFMPPLELTLDEALALVALGKHLGGKDQIPFTGPAARAILKIRGQLPSKIREQLDDIDPYLAIKIPPGAGSDGYSDVYQRVRLAIANRRALLCIYESVGKDAARAGEFTFKPYALFFCQRAWYAIGHHGQRNAVRTLKLSRFAKCEATQSPYAIPDDFTLEKHLGNAWRMIRGEPVYDVELHVDPEFAETLADTKWHRTQRITWNDDGSVTFRCKVAGLDEIVWWVLERGPHVKVKKPPELAERVRKLAEQTARLYAPSEAQR